MDKTSEQFRQEAQVLINEANKVAREHADIKGKIEEAQQAKATAKIEYEQAFDQGDETGMKKCLADIRKANEIVIATQVQLGQFPDRVKGIREKYKVLTREVRSLRPEVELACKKAQDTLKQVEETINFCVYSVQSQISQLESSLQKA